MKKYNIHMFIRRIIKMARGFNENEKQVIKNALIDEGKILFETFGFKKTSIIDITQKVGIAPGTFYTFFPSKEALYFVILEKEELMIREKFTHIHLNKNQQPKVVMKHLLQEMVQMFETNALIREMYIGHHMQQ